ncbi:DNA ligase D [Bacillota bacterium Lsc_1132]
MKPMLPTLSFSLPDNPNWFYEVKYDGFRAILTWDVDKIVFNSRNEKSLLELFPELNDYLCANIERFRPFFPLQFDGELVLLENEYKANFSAIQTRGRMKSRQKIRLLANREPCRFMIFDLLEINGTPLKTTPYYKRKEQLTAIFRGAGLKTNIDLDNDQLLELVKAHSDFHFLWRKVVLHDGEGVVCKQKQSFWEEGKRSDQWLKCKNWKYVICFVTAFDKKNGYFEISVYQANKIYRIGQVLFGFKPEEKQALKQIILLNKLQEDQQVIFVHPAICLEVKYLEVYEKELREPHFHRFRFDVRPEDCTYERFQSQQRNTPVYLEITHPEKPIWHSLGIRKENYLHYLQVISPYMLPFLKDRLLTVIRYPHGMDGVPFYQKNCPDYAPEYIQTYSYENINYIVCNDMETLLWLGNQLAIEWHVPFQTIKSSGPSEIVFDLDPPSKDHFHLAVKAALEIKTVLDELNLMAFVKTSGNKGLQIYLPLPDSTFTYEDTRKFTSFIADFLVSRDPDSFTIERLKKNRGKRLYVDYVQHAEGKTIVAPYSLRGNDFAGAAAPLFWEEVSQDLKPEMFTMTAVLERVQKQINPFENYFNAKTNQPISPVLDFLRKRKRLAHRRTDWRPFD